MHNNMIGIKIQWANHSDFPDTVSVHDFRSVSQPHSHDQKLLNTVSNWYYRLEAAGSYSHLNIAELEFCIKASSPGMA